MILALQDLNQVMRACAKGHAPADGRTLAMGPTLEMLTPALMRKIYGIDSRVCNLDRPVGHFWGYCSLSLSAS